MKLVSGLGRAPWRAPGRAAGSDRPSLALLETSGMHASLCQPGECKHASGPAATDPHADQKTNRVGAAEQIRGSLLRVDTDARRVYAGLGAVARSAICQAHDS